MDEYSIVFARSARHELEVLDPGIIRRILPKIESLANEPRPHGALKLTGEKRLWRIRIGDYRVIYANFRQRTKNRHKRCASSSRSL